MSDRIEKSRRRVTLPNVPPYSGRRTLVLYNNLSLIVLTDEELRQTKDKLRVQVRMANK